LAHKGLILIGGAFVAIGVVVAFQFGRVTTLTCDRGRDRCEIATASWLDTETTLLSLAELREARVAEKPVELPSDRLQRSDLMYRVVLLTGDTEIPLTSYYSGDRQAKTAIATQINIFLVDPSRPTLAVQQDNRQKAYLAGSICAVVGLLAIVSGLRA
jgi:hypothetical protein